MEEQMQQQNTSSLLTANEVKTIAVKTVFWFICFAALFCALFTILFPYQSMYIYFNMGLKTQTYNMAQRIVESGYDDYSSDNLPEYDTKFADAVYMAIDLSADYMDAYVYKYGLTSSKTIAAAENVKYFTDIHAEFIESFSTRDDLIEDSYAATMPYNYLPALYNYEAIVRAANIKANYILNGCEDLDEYFSTLISQFASDEALFSGTTDENFAQMDELTMLFYELNSYLAIQNVDVFSFWVTPSDSSDDSDSVSTMIDGQFSLIFNFDDVENFKTETLENIESILQEVAAFIEDSEATIASEFDSDSNLMLQRAYWAYNYMGLVQEVTYTCSQLDANSYFIDSAFEDSIEQSYNEWNENFSYVTLVDDKNEPQYTTSSWYSLILADYIQAL